MRTRRRTRCAGCGLAVALCLCDELPRLSIRTRVALIMHANEVPKSSNTGRLVLKMIAGAELRVRGRPNERIPEPPPGRRLALFPMPDARPLSAADAQGDAPVLLVPDGNWTQARRMLIRDPWLKDAEIVRLSELPPSRYPLRRNSRPGTACTLEALARALGILEGEAVERALLDALDRFVDRTLRMRRDGTELRVHGGLLDSK
jgi:DTW domain-containing protein YfiP